MENRIFIKQGFYIKIDRDLGETYDNYIKRGYFVSSQKPQSEEEYNEAIKMSRIWINIQNNMSYSENIHNKIYKMETNYYSNT